MESKESGKAYIEVPQMYSLNKCKKETSNFRDHLSLDGIEKHPLFCYGYDPLRKGNNFSVEIICN